MLYIPKSHLFFYIVTCSISIQNLAIKANADIDGTYHDVYTIITPLIDTTQQHLDGMHSLLSDFLFVINDNQIKSLHTKQPAINNIQNLMQELEDKKQILTVSSDLKTIQFIMQYTSSVITHINAVLTEGCKQFPPFNTHQLITTFQSQTEQPSISYLHTLVQNNKNLFQTLSKQIRNVGLHWYNHAYRLLDKHCLHYMREYGLASASLLLGSSYLFWHYYPAIFEDTWIGAPYTPEVLRTLTEHALDDTKLGFLGKTERFIASYWANLLPIGWLLLQLTKQELTSQWKIKAEPWIRKTIARYHYKMMGGSYITKIHKLDGIGKQVLFKDLIGAQYAIDECTYLINYMKDPETSIRRGQKINHLLFTGPPRTGKTELAKALYCEIKKLHTEKVNFIPLPAALINMHGISWLFEIFKLNAPCIVFIDEIDLLNVQRSGKNEVLSALLQGMSGLDNDSDPTKQVIIIGATNKPEYLDFALMTHGRFGKIIHFEYPNMQERIEFFTRHMKKMGLNTQHFNIKKIAKETNGKSYEALKTLFDHGILKARLTSQPFTQRHLDAALDEQLHRIVQTELKQIPEYEKRILAAHFAGHALALHLLAGNTKLSKVTIRPIMATLKEELIGKNLWQGALGKDNNNHKPQERYLYGHTFTYNDKDTINLMDREERIKQCKFHLAGIAAEKILLGNCGYSCHCHDKQNAIDTITPLIFEGLEPHTLTKNIRTTLYESLMSNLKTYEQEITSLLTNHKPELENIAIELQSAQTLDARTITEIVKDTQEDISPV